MKKETLGTTDIRMAPIAFGGNVLGWTADEKTSFKILDVLFEKGFNYIDTANVYSRWVDGHEGGESETILGKWMQSRGNRDQMVIATKVGMDVGQGGIDLSEKHIKEQIDLSLKRLQTDYVDVYFSHKDDLSTPIHETLSAFQELINAGKVKHVGASNFSLERLKESIQMAREKGLPKYQVYQPEYNLMRREEFEGQVQNFCVENQISVTSYFTLASGFLTGKYSSKEDASGRAREGYVSKFFNDKGREVLKTLENLSEKYKASQAAITLAWTMKQPGITAPIASATSTSQLDAFFEAVELEMTPKDLQRLSKVSS